MTSLRPLLVLCAASLPALPAASRPASVAGAPIVFSVSSSESPNSDIYTVLPDGTGLRQLTDGPGLDMHPAWSPDGQRIVFCSDRQGGGRQVYVMAADGSALQPLTHAPALDHVAPSWSPDGARIAFHAQAVDGTAVSRVYVMAADGGEPTVLTDTTSASAYARWSPDGGRLLFMSDRDGNWDLFTMAPDGGDTVRLTDDPADDMDLADPWSPDGSRIAFVSFRAGKADIFVARADGSEPRSLTVGSSLDFAFPSWSPDGSSVVAAQGQGIFGAGSAPAPWSRLCVIDVATGSIDGYVTGEVAPVEGLELEPAWCRLPVVPTLVQRCGWGTVKARSR